MPELAAEERGLGEGHGVRAAADGGQGVEERAAGRRRRAAGERAGAEVEAVVAQRLPADARLARRARDILNGRGRRA
jgi:hypothetical protein